MNIIRNLKGELRLLFSDKRIFIVLAAAGIGFAVGMRFAVTAPARETMYFYDDESKPMIYVSDSEDIYDEIADVPEDHRTVNINTASEYDLAGILPGIGEKKAAAIIEYREINGGFASVEELLEVRGINENLYLKIRPYCRINDDAPGTSGSDSVR